jgi:hypothetical protein
MDYTKLMYDAANQAYAEVVGERHGYTGLTYGLAAVSEAVGQPRAPKYFSHYHHDPWPAWEEPSSASRSASPS